MRTSYERSVIVVAGALAVVTAAVGIWLREGGEAIGTPNPPFLGPRGAAVDPLVVVAILALAAAVFLGPRLLTRPASSRWFALAATALGLAVRIGLALARDGVDGLYAVFDLGKSFEAKNEYLPALRALEYGPGFLLDRFAELVPALPVHAAGHPPGLLLALHWLGIDSAEGMAALCIAVGVVVVPLTYVLAREFVNERGARIAALLVMLSPAAVDFGATSADAVYATIGIATAVALVKWPRAAGPAALALASFFAWSLLAVGAWATVVSWRRQGLRAAIVLAASCAAALVAFYAALWATTGYDPIGTLRATEHVYRIGVASMRPYAYWLFGSPVAWAVAAGIPIAAAWIVAAVRGHTTAVALAAVVLVATIGGFTKAETERIWLFLVPFACLAAAEVLPRRWLTPTLAALAVQALAAELLMESVW